MVDFVNTEMAPKAIGPYSQAVKAGGFLFVSGQIPMDPATGEVNPFGGSAAKQAELALKNLKAILESQGLGPKDVVKTTVYLDDMNNFSNVNEVYAAFFGDHRPARACVEVSGLPKGVAVEIDAVALMGR